MRPQCAICLEVFLESDVVQATKCGHTFHGRCIQQWLEGSSRQCPQCRLNTHQSELVKIYLNMASDTNFEQITDKLRKEAAESKQVIERLRKEAADSKQVTDRLRKEAAESKQVIERLRKEAVERDKLIAEQTAESQQTIKSLGEALDELTSAILRQLRESTEFVNEVLLLTTESMKDTLEYEKQQARNIANLATESFKTASQLFSCIPHPYGFRFPKHEAESETESEDSDTTERSESEDTTGRSGLEKSEDTTSVLSHGLTSIQLNTK